MGQAPTQLPSQFGKYSIVDHLATGGMAEVYLARAGGLQGFEKLVVLKRVRPDVSTAETTESFLDEARLVATLEHPNIAHVHEIGVVNGSYFFVMEYVAGGDLRQLMQRAAEAGRRLRLADALYIIVQVCEALHYAHEKLDSDGKPLKIVHRDVSPSNVLLSHDGAVKVCDFGVAKATSRVHETKGGALKGKYAYMSPEQCRGRVLDRRSDVFSIGILLYELTTLQQLFTAESEFDLMREIIEAPVRPPSEVVVDYPPDLERIVMRALAKEREQRYSSAQALQLDLEEFAREHKLALSSVSVTKLMAELFDRKPTPKARIEPGDTPPTFFALGSDAHDSYSVELNVPADQPKPAPPGRILTVRAAPRRAPGWLLALAGIAGLAAGGVSIAGNAIKAAADREAAAVLDSDAMRLTSAIDSAVRSAQLRAEGIATAPMVRAAIVTDAATMKDLAATEYVFSVANGEAIEIFQLAGAEPHTVTSVLRLPESASPIGLPAGRDAEVAILNGNLTLVQAAPIAGYSAKVSGKVAIRTVVDLSTPKHVLEGHAVAAELAGPASGVIELVAKRGVSSSAKRTIEVHRSGGAIFSLIATPLEGSAPAWEALARLGCLAIAALFVLVYGLALLRARRA